MKNGILCIQKEGVNAMNQTTYLFSLPSFMEGVARVVDFGSTLNQYNDSPTEEQADLRALQSDWEAIGNDMRKIFEDFNI